MHIDSRLFPADPTARQHLEEIWESRQDLREAYPSADSPAFARWAAVNGPLEYPERLASFYPPIPPQELRHTGCGGYTEHDHLRTSIDDLESLLSVTGVWEDRSLAEIDSVLDFGCGCGRVVCWFPQLVPGIRVHGADVNADAIAWCQSNLQGSFVIGGARPPLPLDDNSVDLIYALSVFSHLNRDAADAWIRELARICRPGGRIALTTCGPFTLYVLMRSEEHRRHFQIDHATVVDFSRRLRSEGFLFHRLSRESLEMLPGVEADYGQTFLTDRFVEREWGASVEVLGHVPASLGLLQDFFVLRPRG